VCREEKVREKQRREVAMVGSGVVTMDEKTKAILVNGLFIAFFVGLWLFQRRLTFSQKRKWHPRLTIAGGIFCIVITVALFWHTQWSSSWKAAGTYLFICGTVAGITVLNIKMIRWCEQCQEAVVNNSFFRKFEFCPKCGTKLIK
jgi:hypothetical protein